MYARATILKTHLLVLVFSSVFPQNTINLSLKRGWYTLVSTPVIHDTVLGTGMLSRLKEIRLAEDVHSVLLNIKGVHVNL